MFIPIRTDTPLRRTPYMNYALIVANVLVFIAQQMVLRGPRLEALLLDPERARALGEAARTAASEKFSAEAMARNTLRVFESVSRKT